MSTNTTLKSAAIAAAFIAASYTDPTLSIAVLVIGLALALPIAVVILTAARSLDRRRQANAIAVLERLLARTSASTTNGDRAGTSTRPARSSGPSARPSECNRNSADLTTEH